MKTLTRVGLTLSLTVSITGMAIDSYAQDQLRELSTQLRDGKTSAVQILKTYQERSAKLNPQLAAVIAMRAEATQDAEYADKNRDAKLSLQGLPLMLKDNIAVKGMATTAGSLALLENVAENDAFIVTQLKAQGAIIVGKTNLSEWANFRSTKSTSGWSSVGGQTRNPYDLSKNTCGSSSGSGAAVAARMIPAAIGTETDGSIVCPAAMNGLVGLKPTLGLVSRSGIVPLSHSQDTAGPMTLTVTDAALIMNAIAGSDIHDPATKEADQRRSKDYRAGLNKEALKGLRIGVASQLVKGYDQATLALFNASIAILKAQGAVIINGVTIPHLKQIEKDEFPVLLYEFKADLNHYLASTPSTVKSRNMAEVIRFNTEHAKQVMPYFGQEIMQLAQAKGPLTETTYIKALARAKKLAGPEGIDVALKTHRLDALIAPTTGVAWKINYKKGDHITGSASSPAAIAGYPHLTVPMGLINGLPVGLSFFAGAWQDDVLLNMGYAFEQARPALPAPNLAH
ncbi:MAG: amidase [Undibacterium sp.]|nr:amidase [Undibacterium sp.]